MVLRHQWKRLNMLHESLLRYDSDLIALYVILSDITIFGPETPTHVDMLKQQAQEVLDKVKEISVDDRKVGIRSEIIGSPSAVGGMVGFAGRRKRLI